MSFRRITSGWTAVSFSSSSMVSPVQRDKEVAANNHGIPVNPDQGERNAIARRNIIYDICLINHDED